MTVYYNENDPKAAAWLRELISAGLIAQGEVDERSIEDIAPADLAGFRQHHFFAGIGGWSYALRLAGWPDDKPVWTGSCPCQPFSAAGNRKGADDERHLWPIWRWLVDQCRPSAIFGEQVASPDGRKWFAGVRADLEALGYAAGGSDLCAAGVGSPHIRQRLYWMGKPNSARWIKGQQAAQTTRHGGATESAGSLGGIRNADSARPQGRRVLPERADKLSAWASSPGNWLPCADGKARRIEPGIEPLVNGLPGRVGLLRGYGNAIVPQLAAEFVMAAAQSGQEK